MHCRWLLVVVVGMMVSADAPPKEVAYEKPKEPEGDYIKIEIRGTLDVTEWRGESLGKDGKSEKSVPPGDNLRASILMRANFPGGPHAGPGMPGLGGTFWVLSLDGKKELQDVVRKLKSKKVVVRGIATQTPVAQGPGGPPSFQVEVTSLRAAGDNK